MLNEIDTPLYALNGNRWYCITLWDTSIKNIENLKNIYKNLSLENARNPKKAFIQYMIFQIEITTTTNKEHLQMFIQYSNSIKGKTLCETKLQQQPKKYWFQQSRGTADQARDYCSWDKYPTNIHHDFYNTSNKKINNLRLQLKSTQKRKPDTEIFEFGQLNTKKGYRSDIHKYQTMIKEGATLSDIQEELPHMYLKYNKSIKEMLFNQYCIKQKINLQQRIKKILIKPYAYQAEILKIAQTAPEMDTRKIYWIHDEDMEDNIDTAGSHGKSSIKNYLYAFENAIQIKISKTADVVHSIKNHITENGVSKIIVFDFERNEKDYVNYTLFVQLLDSVITSYKFESGSFCLPPLHVFAFANFRPIIKDKITKKYNISPNRYQIYSIQKNQKIDNKNKKNMDFIMTLENTEIIMKRQNKELINLLDYKN
tara:strand:+ start:936 stop:2213 length:1278 start_codon:yes stop_codon:yes gene_type:complete